MKQTEYLVDSEWLNQQLDNCQVIIVDCRFKLAEPHWGRESYQQSHILGAYYLDLNQDLSGKVELHGGRHPLPDTKVFAQKLSQMGIVKNETLVVAYYDYHFAFAARFWWLLRYLGHNKVVLLDGGWNDWLKSGYPISNSMPESKTGNFPPQPNLAKIVDINQVKLAQDRDDAILLDSRDRDRYLGLREPIDPIAGSIPGAVNSPWQQVSNESGYLQPLSSQQDLWQDLQQAAEIIVYCGSGVTACVNLFSLAMVGIKNTKLYPGSWSDWCSYLEERDYSQH